jgi:dipeptidyl aminopeptidase/acylaminoacyl peptidase
VDLVDAVISGQTAAVLGRRRSGDVWLHEGLAKRRLTTDGNNYAGALSAKGDLLLAKGGTGSTQNIWSLIPGGSLRQVTRGQFDTSPDFSPDGNSWIYVDYPRKSIMICTTGTDRCQVLRRDEILPAWPRFSPDGSRVAYVRYGASSQMMVFSVSGGREWPMGSTHVQCPPVWSSPSNVWTFEGSASGYAWVEKEIETGLRTGRRLQVTENQSVVSDELECWPRDVEPKSPFFRSVRLKTEETSVVLRLPSDLLSH